MRGADGEGESAAMHPLSRPLPMSTLSSTFMSQVMDVLVRAVLTREPVTIKCSLDH